MPKIVAVMTTSRLTFADHAFQVAKAVGSLDMPMMWCQGVFWHVGITGLMEEALKQDPEYILTMDYDTAFEPEQVTALQCRMEARPDIDALAPMQANRHNGAPLAVGLDRREDGLIRARTAHFGLTLLRASSLREFPKPWMMATPNENGSWRTSTAFDIYFWHKWNESGRTLYLDSDVSVGHYEMIVSWLNAELKPVHQLVESYNQFGKPDLGGSSGNHKGVA